MDKRFEKAAAFGLTGGQLRFETITDGHQFVDFGDDAMLFSEWWQRNRDRSNLAHTEAIETACCDRQGLHHSNPSWRIQVSRHVWRQFEHDRPAPDNVVLVDAVVDLPSPYGTPSDFGRATVSLYYQDVAVDQTEPLEIAFEQLKSLHVS